MRLFDLHSHWGTRARLRAADTAKQLAQQQRNWNSTPTYDTEEEMAAYLRRNSVRTILDFGFTKSCRSTRCAPYHDYAIETQRRFPDVDLRQLAADRSATRRRRRVDEFERCIDASRGFVGFCVSAPGMGYPASDPIYDPFYEVAASIDQPVLVLVGHTGSGAGIARRRRRDARSLPSALRRRARGQLSDDLKIIAGRVAVAVAGRDDRGACCTSPTSGPSCTAGRRSIFTER